MLPSYGSAMAAAILAERQRQRTEEQRVIADPQVEEIVHRAEAIAANMIGLHWDGKTLSEIEATGREAAGGIPIYEDVVTNVLSNLGGC